MCIYIAAWREREELWSTPRVASGSCTLLKIDIKVSGLIKECSGVEENLPSESRYKDYLLYWKIKSRYKKKNKRNGIEKIKQKGKGKEIEIESERMEEKKQVEGH